MPEHKDWEYWGRVSKNNIPQFIIKYQISKKMEEQNKQDLSKQSKRLKEIARQLELFRDDLNAYGQFIDRNIKQGNELVKIEKKVQDFLDIYEKFKVRDTLCIEHSKVKHFLIAMEKYYLKLKTGGDNSPNL